jgi:hypothetical protein
LGLVLQRLTPLALLAAKFLLLRGKSRFPAIGAAFLSLQKAR